MSRTTSGSALPAAGPSQTRMSATVLSAIGGGALLAVRAQRPVVIGVGAWKRARPVIVQVRERERVVNVAVMVPVPGIRRRWRRNQDSDRQKHGSAKQIHHF